MNRSIRRKRPPTPTTPRRTPSAGRPATDASVWYTLAGADNGVVVDVSSSDYSAGVIVVSGSPGSFVLETCGPGAVAFFASSGTTYSILAFDDQEDGSGNGGTLQINVEEIPPPPTVDVTVDPVGHFTKGGSAIISGTVTCTGEADFSFIEVSLRQTVGRIFINGFGATDFVCDGGTNRWSVEVFGDNGTFKGGRTASVTIATSCGVFDCGQDFEEINVKLRK